MYAIILIIHALAFFESPSSLSKTSDLRTKDDPVEFPCGVTESVEMLCLIMFVLDFAVKVSFTMFILKIKLSLNSLISVTFFLDSVVL